MKIILASLFAVFLHINFIYAQCNLILQGKVLDHHSNETLPFATIALKGTSLAAFSDSSGNYVLKNLCPGSYTLIVSHLDCNSLEIHVELTENKSLDVFPEHHEFELKGVEISAELEQRNTLNSEVKISGAELEAKRAKGFANALSEIPGVNTINLGNTISKPVIQGMHSNRVLILNNGVKQEGQQWGMDHAPEIDPFASDKITVVKGASALKYGSEAIGGVIISEPKKFREDFGFETGLSSGYATNGNMFYNALQNEGKLKLFKGINYRVQGTYKQSGTLKSPDYFLANTSMNEYNFNYALALIRNKFGTEIYYSQFNTNIGIYKGSHIGTLSDLQNAIKNGGNVDSSAEFKYKIENPKQHVEHEIFKVRNYFNVKEWGKVLIVYARQFNRRQEYDAHGSLAKEGKPGLELELTTHSGEVVLEHTLGAKLNGEAGIQSNYQSNVYNGRYFIPDYTSQSHAAFIIEKLNLKKIQLEGGVRADYKMYNVLSTGTVSNFLFMYSKLTYGGGLQYTLNKYGKVLLSSSAGWRAPAINELFANGLHHGAASFELGNQNLKIESSHYTSLNYNLNHNLFEANVLVYNNYIKNYIYLKPALYYTYTIRGAFPVFNYVQTNARIQGVDAWMEFKNSNVIRPGIKASYLHANDLISKEPLYLMPANRIETYVKITPKKLNSFNAKPSYLYVTKQNRVPDNFDYMEAPKAFSLVNVELNYNLKLRENTLSISISINNLLNQKYRDYLNRLRYYADEIGRNILLNINYKF